MNIKLHHGDLPDGLDLGPVVAVDCEMGGLNPWRDRLFLIQLKGAGEEIHLVKFGRGEYKAPNLVKLLGDANVTKILHVGVCDIATVYRWLGVLMQPIFDTKVASRLARPSSEAHGMKYLIKDHLGAEIPKNLGTSDWGTEEYTQAQLEYAANDVVYLHALREKLTALLVREGRLEIAQKCFDFLPTKALLDLYGWDDENFLTH